MCGWPQLTAKHLEMGVGHLDSMNFIDRGHQAWNMLLFPRNFKLFHKELDNNEIFTEMEIWFFPI